MEDWRVPLFWKKIRVLGPDDCWLWTAARAGGANGAYGVFAVAKTMPRMDYAHRVAWRLANGPIPGGLSVCHKCDVPLCCNPSHMFLGTHKDNMSDCAAKSRNHRATRLTLEQVHEILGLHRSGMGPAAIARMFCVSRGAVYGIITGVNWRRFTGGAVRP